MRVASRVSAALLAALWLGSLLAWPHLPARIPTHFGFSGKADSWAETTLLSWFGLPLLALAIVLLNVVLARQLPRRPGLFNLSDKQRFLALPSEYQAPVIRRMQDFLHWVSAQMVLLFGLVQWAIYRTAQGADTRTYMLFILILSVAVLPVLLLWSSSSVEAEIARQFRRFQQQVSPEPA